MNPLAYAPMILKTKAREALKRNFSAALMVCFLASLPSLLTQTFLLMMLSKGTVALNDWVVTLPETVTPQQLADALPALRLALTEAIGWLPLAALAGLGLSVLCAFLTVSQANAELRLLRAESITAGDALSRLNCFWKAIAMELWKGLLVLLWSLPGLAISALGAAMAARRGDQSGLGLLGMEGSFVTAFLVGWAYLRYRLAPCVMADHPELGPIRCVRESRRLMKGNTGKLLMLVLSFLLIYLGIDLLSTLLSGAAQLVGLTCSLLFSLVLTLYIDTTVCAFYEQRLEDERTAAADGFEKADPAFSDLTGEEDGEHEP